MWNQRLYTARSTNVGFGILLVAFGFTTYFISSWSGKDGEKPYRVCLESPFKEIIKAAGFACPHIAMEIIFLAATCFCALFSILVFIVARHTSLDKSPFKQIEAICYGVCAIFLLIGSILYIVSAVQTDKLIFNDSDFDSYYSFTVLMWPKVICGVVGIVAGSQFIYSLVVVLRQSNIQNNVTVTYAYS